MQITITLLTLVFFGSFIYIWYELHIRLNLHIDLKNPKTNQYLKISKKYLQTSDNFRIASWYMPIENSKAVLILVDGYKKKKEDKIRMFAHAEYLKEAGYSTLLIDLRSFGKSDGHKITFGINEWKDVEAAYDYLKSLPENKDKKIGFLGISMGSVISIIARAITGKGDFIIASTPYLNFKSIFAFRIRQKRLPSFLFLPMLQIAALFELGFDYEHYTPLNIIRKINVPILIISAKHDQSVNYNDAKEIYDKANNPKEYWQTNTSHRVFIDNPKKFQKRVLSFLSKYT